MARHRFYYFYFLHFFKRTLQFSVLFIWLVLGYICWMMLKDPQKFPIHTVKVQASYAHINPQALKKIISPYVNHGFFNLSATALANELAQQPWIAGVDIQRVWPDMVVVKIQEQEAVAQLGENALLNPQAGVFKPEVNTFPRGLPRLNAPEDQVATAWQYLQAMNNQLQSLGLKIQELDLTARQSIQVQLNDGTLLLFGKGDPSIPLQRMVAVYPKILGKQRAKPVRIDLRYNNGLAIAWEKEKAL